MYNIQEFKKLTGLSDKQIRYQVYKGTFKQKYNRLNGWRIFTDEDKKAIDEKRKSNTYKYFNEQINEKNRHF